MENTSKTAARTMADIQADVTARIVTQLENGVAPWVRPWGQLRGTANRGNPLPHNAVSGGEYSGVNLMLLAIAQDAGGYMSAGWLTFGQAIKAGGGVRKGEKGTKIVKVGQMVKKVEDKNGEESTRAITWLKEYTVFNLEQCDRLPEAITAPAFTPRPDALERMRAGVAGIVARHSVNLTHGGDRACYSPSLDGIKMPDPACFKAPAAYDATLLHELTHWTGHPDRLARPLFGFFGSPDYAREELVAELGAAFMCAALGIDGQLQHAEYLASWLRVLKEDSKAIFKASSAARKASEYLQGITAAAEDDDKAEPATPAASKPAKVAPAARQATPARASARAMLAAMKEDLAAFRKDIGGDFHSQCEAFLGGFGGRASYLVNQGTAPGDFVASALRWVAEHGDVAGNRYQLAEEVEGYARYDWSQIGRKAWGWNYAGNVDSRPASWNEQRHQFNPRTRLTLTAAAPVALAA